MMGYSILSWGRLMMNFKTKSSETLFVFCLLSNDKVQVKFKKY